MGSSRKRTWGLPTKAVPMLVLQQGRETTAGKSQKRFKKKHMKQAHKTKTPACKGPTVSAGPLRCPGAELSQ